MEAAVETIDRAVGLERAAGRNPDPEGMTVDEAKAILERHGEDG